MPRKKLTPQQAKAMLMADGMTFQEDFHALGSSAVQALADTAKLAGYRKSKNAPGSTARMFYQYLSRVEPVVHVPGHLTPAERRAYQARDRRSHSTKKSPAQLQREIDGALHQRPFAKTSHATKFSPGDPRRYPGYAIASTDRGDDAYFRSKDAAFRAAQRLADDKNRRVEVARITKTQDRHIVGEVYPARW